MRDDVSVEESSLLDPEQQRDGLPIGDSEAYMCASASSCTKRRSN